MAAAKSITIDGIPYRVVERMGYQPSIGGHAARVMGDHDGIIRVAVRLSGCWRFWTEVDRISQMGKCRPTSGKDRPC